MNDNIVKIENLKKSYENGNITSLNGIDLEIKKGQFVSIIGPSGSGKSTLLNMIGALDAPDEGNITVAGENLIENKNLSDFRANKIGFVFQLHNLIPNLSVVENIEIPMYSIKSPNSKKRQRALDLLNMVELEDKAYLKPTVLSGGERQRVAIARALANNPSIILADEPTGALDSKTSKKILNHLINLHNEENLTIIMVTHDIDVARLADRAIKVLDGTVLESFKMDN